MEPTVPSDLLSRHPGEGVRLLLRAQRDELCRHARLFQRMPVDETLAALRDAAHRMRTTLRAYRGSLPRRLHALRGPLRDLLRATAPARDAHAALGLLEQLAVSSAPGLSSSSMPSEIEGRFRKRWKRRRRRARREVGRLLPKILRRLGRDLDRYEAQVQPAASPTFDAAVRSAIEVSSYRLSCVVARPCAPEDERAIRRVQKRAQALRHLLEPVLPFSPGLADPIRALADLHERLGAQLDRALLSRQLLKAARRAPARLAAAATALAEAASKPPAWSEDAPDAWDATLSSGALFAV